MLGRTANNVYWMARYIERAENLARLLASSYHMSLLPATSSNGIKDWDAPLRMVGARDDYVARHQEITAGNVLAYMTIDPDNPNSIRSCIRLARENARATRPWLTTEVWEGINETYLQIEAMSFSRLVDQGFQEFFDWVKERSHLFRGIVHGTLRRAEAFSFSGVGTFIERADNTARFLAIKWQILNPAGRPLGAEDYYRWGALLRAFSAFKAYREVYSSIIEPKRVAELLVLRRDIPRSLSACTSEVTDNLRTLRTNAMCTRVATQLRERIERNRIDGILRSGLPDFLNTFVARNNELHGMIGREFMLVR
jgi:uncharacterized alpha-E superfamily protein